MQKFSAFDLGDLTSKLKMSMSSGQIWLDNQRMVLIHAEAMGVLRKEMIDTLGMDRARGLLTRMGYASGIHDARMARRMTPNASDSDLLLMGPKLHTMEGMVKVSPLQLEMDISKGIYRGEFLWEYAFEGEVHKETLGLHTEPVCWIEIGYACGYTSELMGKFIFYKEVECTACGDPHCRIVGKPADEWGDEIEADLRYFEPDSVADHLIELQTQVENLRHVIEQDVGLGDLVGQSPAFQESCEMVKKAASSQVTVLLLGETGVGKEMFARALYKVSDRAAGPFVAVNCAAIPEELIESELFGVEKGAFTGANKSRPGRFERAHGGTLFLDEVGELSASAQAKLLRVLQEGEFERVGDVSTRKVDVRLIAATNVDLGQAVQEGKFRADLYYRLNIYPVMLPPLRERKDDIPLLVDRFLAKHCARHGKKVNGVTDETMKSLMDYNWPGNIRELENVIERGVILAPSGGLIDAHQIFPCADPSGRTVKEREEAQQMEKAEISVRDMLDSVLDTELCLDDMESLLIDAAMDKANGNLSHAARLLGLTRPQFAYRLKKRQGEG